MKLVRFGDRNCEKPGVLHLNGHRLDLSGHFQDWNPDFFARNGIQRLAEILQSRETTLPCVAATERWAAPVARPGKIICIGLNYSDHASESGMPIPAEPIVFLKGSNTVVGPYDDVLIPRGSWKTDWEAELGVIVGAEARYLDSIDAAARHIAGYCISHDVSEREFQLERGGQWSKGKGCDTFNPLGPFLLTADEMPICLNLTIKLQVNGHQRQRGSTAMMIFSPAYLVHYLSQFMTLESGDLISTGTPPGVGLGMNPPEYLKPGDVVELEIEHLGTQRQLFRAS